MTRLVTRQAPLAAGQPKVENEIIAATTSSTKEPLACRHGRFQKAMAAKALPACCDTLITS